MTGRHRQTRTSGTQRALLGTVPVLGVAGVVTALAAPGAAPQAPVDVAQVTTPEDGAPPAPGVLTEVPGHGEDAAGAAADAAGAATRAADRQDARQRRDLNGAVAQVRDDAQQRRAKAERDGEVELDQFHQEQQRAQEPAPPQQDHTQQDHRQSVTDETGDAPQCDPGRIVGQDCGLFGLVGNPGDRSDPWIDGQLLDPLSPGPQ